MARPSNISRRIERLLNDNYLRRAFSGGVRARAAVLVVPVVLFAATAMIRVQAATQSHRVPSAQVQALAASVLPATPAAVVTLVPREFAAVTPPALPSPPAPAANDAKPSEAMFDRNLSFNGTLELSVSTGSGNITLTRGSANQIHIHGIVRAGENADPSQAQQIVANPPITQEGNAIRIGNQQQNLRDISISYEIEAPADTDLNAATGSGNINDTGVGHNAKLTTGSGNIMATGLEGDFKTQTGSGNIKIHGSGQGDAKATTGSGDIDLQGVHGALEAQTGSGTIKAAGTPSAAWKLQAGSGTIELATGNAPMNLDAMTGSGKISTNPPIAVSTPEDRHHLHAQLHGGGPAVRVETGSGDIQVE